MTQVPNTLGCASKLHAEPHLDHALRQWPYTRLQVGALALACGPLHLWAAVEVSPQDWACG